MDLSNASKLADFSSGIGTQGAQLKIDDINQRVGIGTTNPQALLQVGTDVTVYGNSGIVSATSFYGSAEGLIGIGGTDDVVTESLKVIGISTFVGDVSIGGTLTCEGVTDVNSIGVITARTGLKVTSGGINAPAGVVTATSFVGSGTALTGVEPGIVNLVASGVIDNGKTVIIKDDGTVGIVTQITSNTPSAGDSYVFESSSVQHTAATYDPDNGKVVIAYRDLNNSGHGYAVVGTVSGTSISFGGATVFASSDSQQMTATYDTANDKVVIAYTNSDDTYKGYAVVGTVTGTSITFGTPVKFEDNNTNSEMSAVFDSSNDKVVIAYRGHGGNSHGTAIVGTVSGTGSGATIGFGGATVYEAADIDYASAAYVGSSKVVIAYRDQGNSNHGTVIVGTVSGTSISFPSVAVVYNNANSGYVATTYDSTNDRVVIAYQDHGNSAYGRAIVGTVSGTTINFPSSSVEFVSAAAVYNKATFDSTNGKVVIVYQKGFTPGYAIVGTVDPSDNTITFSSEVEFESGTTYYPSCTYDSSNNKVVIAYRDDDESPAAGTAVVFGVTSETTNLTTENYIGIAAEAIANAATGKITTIGGVNSGQSGLTTAQTYYVGQSGILTTTADTPSVVAGTSMSGTEILIR